eukprot:1188552-Prorocentrum_minimum.AAC.1
MQGLNGRTRRYLPQGRTKEKKYTFDRVFGKHCSNADIFEGTVEPILVDVVNGISATVFAYGATGR